MTHEPNGSYPERGALGAMVGASPGRAASPPSGSRSGLSPEETARLLLTVGGRSLWADLEGRDTRPDERRPLPLPGRFRDGRAERLLLGCCLASGHTGVLRAKSAGLRAEHFTEPKHQDVWACITDWPADPARILARLGMMIEYLDAERVVNDERWRQAVADGALLPTRSFVSCADAARGLAERIVRLAKVREKLREAEQLLNGRPLHEGKGGIGL